MVFCSECGYSFGGGKAKFCPECGTKFPQPQSSSSPAPAPAPVSVSSSTPAAQPAATTGYSYNATSTTGYSANDSLFGVSSSTASTIVTSGSHYGAVAQPSVAASSTVYDDDDSLFGKPSTVPTKVDPPSHTYAPQTDGNLFGAPTQQSSSAEYNPSSYVNDGNLFGVTTQYSSNSPPEKPKSSSDGPLFGVATPFAASSTNTQTSTTKQNSPPTIESENTNLFGSTAPSNGYSSPPQSTPSVTPASSSSYTYKYTTYDTPNPSTGSQVPTSDSASESEPLFGAVPSSTPAAVPARSVRFQDQVESKPSTGGYSYQLSEPQSTPTVANVTNVSSGYSYNTETKSDLPPNSSCATSSYSFPDQTNPENILENIEKVKISQEEYGDGSQIRILDTVRPVNSNSLQKRRQCFPFNAQREENGYQLSCVAENVNVVHIAQPSMGDIYSSYCLPDDASWQRTLRELRNNGSKFTDPDFPPDNRSLFTDVSNPRYPQIADVVSKWRRISEFFSQTAYVQITMYDDDKKLICGVSICTEEDFHYAESISVDSRFTLRAQDSITTALDGKKRDFFLMCTTDMIMTLQEYVDNAKQRIDAIFKDGLKEVYAPLRFAGIGKAKTFRPTPNRVAVIASVLFQAPRVQLFEPQKENDWVIGDVRHGKLANGYLFGALGTLSTCPSRLYDVFPEMDVSLLPDDQQPESIGEDRNTPQVYNEEGVYAVRFWRQGRSFVVVVDDWIPCNESGRPVFGGFTSNGFEIWSMVVEKAYAKFNRGYENLIGGQEAYALLDLAGGTSTTYSLVSDFRNSTAQPTDPTKHEGLRKKADELFNLISKSMRKGSLFAGYITEYLDESLLKAYHLQPMFAYGVLQVAKVQVSGQVHDLVQIRDCYQPQSFDRINAPDSPYDWGIRDEKWKLFSKEQMQSLGSCCIYRQNGTFWMNTETFCAIFSDLIELKDYMSDPKLTTHFCHGEWQRSTAGGRHAPHVNPQFQLVVPQDMHLTIELEQPSRRILGLPQFPLYIAPMVLRNGTAAERTLSFGSNVVATGTFISNQTSVLEVDLKAAKEPYVIVPCTYDPNQISPFVMRLSTTERSMIVPVSDSSLPHCTVCSQVLNGPFRSFNNDRVCVGCVDRYQEMNTKRCVHCKEAIVAGKFYTLQDGSGSCHDQCLEAYQAMTAEKCAHCFQPVVKIEGRFSGTFYKINGDSQKVHAECIESYRDDCAEKCAHCSSAIRVIQDRFSGKFYLVQNGAKKVHFECFEGFQRANAPKCKHCTEPLLKVPGRFDGRFYELTDKSGKVHFECWQAFRASLQ